jgi:transcriptional regulator with XRE-family HTH domain
MAAKRPQLAKVRRAAGFTQETLAEAICVDVSTIRRWEAGTSEPLALQRPKVARSLKISMTELEALLSPVGAVAVTTQIQPWLAPINSDDDEQDALELARRVSASDVGHETLDRLEAVVDELAIAYPKTPPADLLERTRRHLHYVSRLLDARKTLAEHRRLLVVGGWLSLLGATVHIDLNQPEAATARLKTAASLATHADHAEIHAWTFETEAWRVLTEGNYAHALELSHQAKAIAPAGSSVAIQATAQSGRAYARLGQAKETYAALAEVQQLVSPLKRPDRPEHHYRYDPDKSIAYTATTLAWIGDPAAEGYAREIIKRLDAGADPNKWPRRVASANIDMSLALLVTNRIDEASYHTMQALTSGRVVPSNQWRAAEVVRAVESKGLHEAAELREVYEAMRQQ